MNALLTAWLDDDGRVNFHQDIYHSREVEMSRNMWIGLGVVFLAVGGDRHVGRWDRAASFRGAEEEGASVAADRMAEGAVLPQAPAL